MDTGNAGKPQDFSVGGPILPNDVKQTVEAPQVDQAELLGVSGVGGPGLTDVEHGGKNYCSVDFQLASNVEPTTLPVVCVKYFIGSTCFGDSFPHRRLLRWRECCPGRRNAQLA